MTASEFRRLISGDLPRNGITTPIGNRKVLNATKTEENGASFDSRLERYMHDLLKSHGIGFLFQKRYTLQEPFTYNGENVRAITYTLDFYLPEYDMAIDTKGVATQQGKIRIKMLKRLFADLGRTTTIELPRTKDECAALVARLTSNRYNESYANQYHLQPGCACSGPTAAGRMRGLHCHIAALLRAA